MPDSKGRSAVHVRLIGQRAERVWRPLLLAEGFFIPAHGPRHACLLDVTGAEDPAAEIRSAVATAGTEPLVVIVGLHDPLPEVTTQGVSLVRLDKPRIGPVSRALKSAAQSRQLAQGAATRLKALAALGQAFPAVKTEGQGTPAALLSDPAPSVLSLLRGTGWQELVAPLTSSQTLRLLETHQASALVIHLASDQEHRIPVLKLIRRQSDLHALPVAVLSEDWDEEKASGWFAAGADLLARPGETSAVLSHLRALSDRFLCDRALRTALSGASTGEIGEASPIMSTRMFDRVVLEHQAQGDSFMLGAISLDAEQHGSDADLSEAGVYMAMALSPLDIICRPRPDLFLIAMPYADKFYAGRTLRTLQTLIEDLKFGQEPDAVLIAARTASVEGGAEDLGSLKSQLLSELAKRRASLLHA